MTELLGIARFKFREGKREEYLRLSEQANVIVEAKDSGTLQYDLFLNLLRVMPSCRRAQRSGQQVAKLAAAREASAILDRYYQHPSLNRDGRYWLPSALRAMRRCRWR